MEKVLALVLVVYVASTSAMVEPDDGSNVMTGSEACQEYQFKEWARRAASRTYLLENLPDLKIEYNEEQFLKKFTNTEFFLKPDEAGNNDGCWEIYYNVYKNQQGTTNGESLVQLTAAKNFAELPSIIVSRDHKGTPYALETIYVGFPPSIHFMPRSPDFVRITLNFEPGEGTGLPSLLVKFHVYRNPGQNDKINTAISSFLKDMEIPNASDKRPKIPVNVVRRNLDVITSALTSWRKGEAQTYAIVPDPDYSDSVEPKVLEVLAPCEYTDVDLQSMHRQFFGNPGVPRKGPENTS